ncbi:MAG: NTP transferase domain-containing protein [Phycisphaeraceae bacterium]|nr:NTP transferase domain-containing protein [Phycisphaeraceae bacterium]
MNAAIITARAGSKSIVDKNVHTVRGRALVAYPIQAALDAARIDQVFISTDGQSIAEVGESMGCRIIWRPESLAGDTVNHGDVIRHAVEEVEREAPDLENVALLLGNTVMVDGDLIDLALATLDERSDADSIMTVWEAADDHPLRSLEIRDGVLRPYGDVDRMVSTERQSYPRAYYYDQGVWAFRKYTVKSKDGPNPWWWMGKRSLPIIRTWVTGRDIHTMFDVAVAEWYLDNRHLIKSSGEWIEAPASPGDPPTIARRE